MEFNSSLELVPIPQEAGLWGKPITKHLWGFRDISTVPIKLLKPNLSITIDPLQFHLCPAVLFIGSIQKRYFVICKQAL